MKDKIKPQKVLMYFTDGKKKKQKGKLIKYCVMDFPLKLAMYQLGKNIEIVFCKSSLYNFKIKKPLKNVVMEALMSPVTNKKQFNKLQNFIINDDKNQHKIKKGNCS